MRGTLIVDKINARSEPNKDSVDVGDLYRNDRVYGEVANGWIKIDRIYKANGIIDTGTKGYAAVFNPLDKTQIYMELDNAPEPAPPIDPPDETPTIKPLTVTIGGDDYETVTITLNPKAND